MPPTREQSVLGFGAHLDRRRTIFVPALPTESLCSLCDLFSAASFRLPCDHLLCEACYRHCGQISSHCPLHKRAFKQEEVVPSFISKDVVLGLRMRCWNAGNGCDAEDFVSVMVDHFANACMFHTLNCPKCGNKMLHRELPGHVMSGCPTTCSPGKRALESNLLEGKKMLYASKKGFSTAGSRIDQGADNVRDDGDDASNHPPYVVRQLKPTS
ncbi:hypothetical protein HPB51_026412 [Rhipicephalus microplus]|uniref:Uncharacterized protein n=1 Tax=Rhipicephalus microplus TaxID=6941 RepID=A0A9J6D2P2_RHIMP|nr:hypothetical protein HPB51_026412 [Rhipicephalus microplus]